ncbi:Glycosyltransferase involved in cell wall bisynthesis [Paraoerskovia marina]|uniref:Glycosyltransferase involved in cell wall bisynthesis n=1 Tax=Paraoerskovia marina TaxID=545619 RepID=A0A1H1TI52_9CELL|nr:glycosyltransferase family 4 protein [Paraoerskovia marina]SDS59666.1 Glycosyltransferase involved in cell wall bisynthesis [Paraoerskovia marina]
MRVVQVLGSSAGGVARHVAQVAQALTDAGIDTRVVGPRSVEALAAPPGVPFAAVEITDRPRPADVAAATALRRAVVGADVVHAHGLRAGALVVLATRGLRARPRIVVTVHNLPVGSRAVRGVSAVLERIVARGSDVVLGVSGDLVDAMAARGARDVARALVPAPSLADGPVPESERSRAVASVREELGIDPDEGLVVTVARLAPQKGLSTLVDAAAMIDHDVTWVVAGDGPLREELLGRAVDRGAPVSLLGRRDDVDRLLLAADVVVSAAVWEGQPIGVQEALGAGAALVVTDAGGTCEVTGDAARVVPVGDARGLADAVGHVLGDEAERDRLRSAARDRFLALPRVEDVVGQLLRAYAGGTSVTS